MKKGCFISLIFLILIQGISKGQDTVKPSKLIDSILAAHHLVKKGYQTKDASLLLRAAVILSENKVNVLKTEPKAGERMMGSVQTQSEGIFDLNKILNDAKSMAKGDSKVIEQITEMENQSNFATLTRSLASPPYIKNDRISSKSQTSYTVFFKKGKIAEVYVEGDGTTSLDLIIYDKNNRKVISQKNQKSPYVYWKTSYSGSYKVLINNISTIYNNFLIIIN